MTATSDNAVILEQLRTRIAQLETELSEARTDPTTGLPTRRLFMRRAEAAWPDAGAVLFADLDRFKDLNDTYGHDAGNEVLAEVAERLRTALGSASVVGRLYGDEFAAVLPISPLRHHLERVLDFLTEEFVTTNGVTIRPSVSVGVVLREQVRAVTLNEALHGADAAMYAAKRGGHGFAVYAPDVHGRLEINSTPSRRVRYHGYAA